MSLVSNKLIKTLARSGTFRFVGSVPRRIDAPVTVVNPANDRSCKLKCQVDTGATFLSITPLVSQELGLRFGDDDVGTMTIANGRIVCTPIATINVAIPESSNLPVTVASVMSQGLIGLVPLAKLGVAVDCTTAKLTKGKGFSQEVQSHLLNEDVAAVRKSKLDHPKPRDVFEQNEYIRSLIGPEQEVVNFEVPATTGTTQFLSFEQGIVRKPGQVPMVYSTDWMRRNANQKKKIIGTGIVRKPGQIPCILSTDWMRRSVNQKPKIIGIDLGTA